jgi:hypothetical protein
MHKKPKWFVNIGYKLDFDFENTESETEEEAQRIVMCRALTMASVLIANLQKDYGPITLVNVLYCLDKTMFKESMSCFDDILEKTKAGTYHTLGWATYGHEDDSEEEEGPDDDSEEEKQVEKEAENEVIIYLTDDSDE